MSPFLNCSKDTASWMATALAVVFTALVSTQLPFWAREYCCQAACGPVELSNSVLWIRAATHCQLAASCGLLPGAALSTPFGIAAAHSGVLLPGRACCVLLQYIDISHCCIGEPVVGLQEQRQQRPRAVRDTLVFLKPTCIAPCVSRPCTVGGQADSRAPKYLMQHVGATHRQQRHAPLGWGWAQALKAAPRQHQ